MNSKFLLSFLFFSPLISAAADLPLCIDNEVQIKEIQSVMRDNFKNSKKYDGFKKALAASSDVELIARLTYAETLAAKCSDNSSTMAPAIAATIKNRIRIRNGNVRSVIFEKDQFASSLNNYDGSLFREFLCPKNLDVWKMSAVAVQKELAGFPPMAVHYYLYKHSARFKPPGWAEGAQSYSRVGVGSVELDECIKFFKNPKWK